MIDAAVETFGGLHVPFNNAGTVLKGTFADITDEATTKMIDVNFKSLMFCFKYQVLSRFVGVEYVKATISMQNRMHDCVAKRTA